MYDKYTFGRQLNALLSEQGLTQRAFANMLDINECSLSAWCVGRYEPKASTLIKIADALDCTIDYLLGRE